MNTTAREALLEIFQAGIEAVAPDSAILNHIKLDTDSIKIGDKIFNIPKQGIHVIGGGKGAAPMAAALENLLGDKIQDGLIVVKYGHELNLDKIKVEQANHPVPDEAGVKGAELCLNMAKSCKSDDLLICVLTGGASALLPSPLPPLDLEDLRKATSELLACGANIEEINIIRKHLSSLSGGRLALAANGAQVLTLIVSDVLGDDPASIASGPCSPDPSTYTDCLDIIQKYQLEDKLPTRALAILRDGQAGNIPETPKADNPVFKKVHNFIVASNGQALQAAAKKSESLGFDTRIIPQSMEGEAADYAKKLIFEAKKIQKEMEKDAKPICLISGGETTVSLSGTGRGGRNQEMALSASIELEGSDGIYCLFAGTDGTDGPTEAAGGFADSATIGKMGGLDEATKFLKNHDSYEALKKGGAHLITGPTRTNVMDIAIILIEGKE